MIATARAARNVHGTPTKGRIRAARYMAVTALPEALRTYSIKPLTHHGTRGWIQEAAGAAGALCPSLSRETKPIKLPANPSVPVRSALVAAVGEPTDGVGLGDGGERSPGRGAQIVVVARPGASE